MSMLGLHNLKAAAGSKKNKIRRGRGNASGRGNYSGRGGKGQRARSGGKSGLVLFGVKTYMQKIPKSRGFKSLADKPAEINLKEIAQAYQQGEAVDPISLFKKGLIKTAKHGVKILARGGISQALNITANGFSASAKDAIVKAGGQAIVIVKQKVHPEKTTKPKAPATTAKQGE